MLALALGATGCQRAEEVESATDAGVDSASDGAVPDVALADAFIGCMNEPQVDVYQPNLTKTSADGTLQVVLVSADPIPPAQGTNTWTIRVEDATGTPLQGATITVTPFMPEHGHGTSVVPVVTANADASYTVSSLYLFMAGLWRVTFTVTPEDAASPASVAFFFCVQG
jgi:hypothetical protein